MYNSKFEDVPDIINGKNTSTIASINLNIGPIIRSFLYFDKNFNIINPFNFIYAGIFLFKISVILPLFSFVKPLLSENLRYL